MKLRDPESDLLYLQHIRDAAVIIGQYLDGIGEEEFNPWILGATL